MNFVIPTGAQRSQSQPFVIPAGAQRSGGTCCRLQRHCGLRLSTPLTSESGR